MNKATRIIGSVLLLSGLGVSLASAQTSAAAGSAAAAPATKFPAPARPAGPTPPVTVLIGFRPLVSPLVPRVLPTVGTPRLDYPVRPLSALVGLPRPVPRPPVLPIIYAPAGGSEPQFKPTTLSDVNGYDR